MKDIVIVLFFSVLIIGGFFYPTLSYLILYKRASKKWNVIQAKKTGEVAYARSFGGVAIVEYEYKEKTYNVEVYKASFSQCFDQSNVKIMVNPEKPEECVQINRDQVLKNILALIFLGLVLIGLMIFATIEAITPMNL